MASAEKHTTLDGPADNTASAGRRLTAAIIDGVIAPVGLGLIIAGVPPIRNLEASSSWPVLAFSLFYLFLYYAALTTALGGTPGKLLVGIEVVRRDGDWPVIEWSFVRFAVWLLLSVIAWATVLGKTRRGLHDFAAGTFVIKR